MKKIIWILIMITVFSIFAFMQGYASQSRSITNDNNNRLMIDNWISCTTEYAPVCAQPPMPTCPEGLSCIQVMPALKTYGNACEAWVAGAEIVYQGECRGDNDSRPNPNPVCRQDSRICPDGSTVERTWPNCTFAACPVTRPTEPVCQDIYMPVCGVDGVTYPNRCDAWNVRISHAGQCESLINRDQIQRLNDRFEPRYRTLVNQVPRENIPEVIDRIDTLIETTRRSRIAPSMQTSRITTLVFLRNIFEDTYWR